MSENDTQYSLESYYTLSDYSKTDYEALHTVATHAWSALVLAQRFTDTRDINDPYYKSLYERIGRVIKELEAYGCHE